MSLRTRFELTASALFLLLSVAACGGGGGSSSTPTPPAGTFAIGGTVTGLAAGTQIVLKDGGSDAMTVSTNSAFTFTTPIALGGSYSVTVDTQPSVGSCRVTNGTGSNLQATVTTVNVICRLGIAYVANANTNDNTIWQYTIGGDGSLTPLGTPIATGSSPHKIAVDPAGKFAYVTNFGTDVGTPGAGNTVSQYTIGADGTLTSNGTVVTGLNPYAIAIDSTGKYAYVTNQGSDTVSQFTVGSDGVLTPMATLSVPSGHVPYGLSIDPSGKYVYVANLGNSNTKGTTVSQYLIGTGGALAPMTAPLVTTGRGPLGITVDAAGKYAYVSNFFDLTVSQFNIDGTTGALVPSGLPNVATGTDPYPVAITPNAKYAYFSNKFDDTISQCSVGTAGALNCSAGLISTSSTHPAQPQFIAFDPFGLYAYVVNFNTGVAGTIAKYSIGATGLLVPIAAAPTAATGNGPFSIVTTR